MRTAAVIFAPAKINLGLAITGRYTNGYHRLETVFLPVTLFDKLSIRPSTADIATHIWPDDAGAEERRALALGTVKNPLLMRCLELLRRHLAIPPVSVTLKKRIPSPSGLGGASADAAALIAALWQAAGGAKNLPPGLIQEAEKLGADIPFFLEHGLHRQAAVLKGVGHELTAVTVPALAGWICVPDFGFPTAQMFAEVRRWNLPEIQPDSAHSAASSQSNLALRLNEIPYSDEPISGVRLLRNDFDAAARTAFPGKSQELEKAKVVIARAARQFFPGEWVVGMTGSGAGLFAATSLEIPMPKLKSLGPLLKARLGQQWRVLPFRNIGP
jgi:4-diphosphocytidyl-2-C-methyl-D-erythritol kinase